MCCTKQHFLQIFSCWDKTIDSQFYKTKPEWYYTFCHSVWWLHRGIFQGSIHVFKVHRGSPKWMDYVISHSTDGHLDFEFFSYNKCSKMFSWKIMSDLFRLLRLIKVGRYWSASSPHHHNPTPKQLSQSFPSSQEKLIELYVLEFELHRDKEPGRLKREKILYLWKASTARCTNISLKPA